MHRSTPTPRSADQSWTLLNDQNQQEMYPQDSTSKLCAVLFCFFLESNNKIVPLRLLGVFGTYKTFLKCKETILCQMKKWSQICYELCQGFFHEIHSLPIDHFNGIHTPQQWNQICTSFPGKINILSLHFLERVVFAAFINLMKSNELQ